MGSSRDIAIGPVAVVSLLLGEALKREINPKKHPNEYLRLAFTATFFAGITQAALGFLRLGFLVDFLSHAAVVGFMAGAAITIGLQQLKGLFGITNFTTKTDIVSVMHSVFGNIHHGWNWQTVVIGMTFLAFLLTTKYIASKKKNLFWIAAVAPLISVIVSTFCVYITHANKDGVKIVAISIAKILFQVMRPRMALLGNLPRTGLYRNIEQYPEAVRVPKVLIIRVDAAIYFSNSNYIKERTLRYLRDEEDLNKEHGLPRIEYIIFEMSAVTDIDTTGIHELEELLKVLKKLYIQLELVNPGPVVMDKLLAAGYIDMIGQEHIFLTVGDAVACCSSKPKDTVNA
ncbi:Sulfate transporter [Rhynchospora pubera]|uniref:Sulfate transporter n=1 Tax=Rhynchospora pubera TaxID=906938 RepID=A0AAV8C4Z3_9POAL|nr:Sulfate transporter [Rhynchospora pubera]